jgi:parallel beta-helix repeat protein
MLESLRRAAPAFFLGLILPGAAIARTIVVQSGGSIRSALARAQRGDRIEVMPGVYHEGSPGELNALTITDSGIKLVGVPSRDRPVVLENPGGQSFGIWVSPTDSAGPVAESDPEHPPCEVSGARVQDFSLSGFTVRGFTTHGVHLVCVDGFSLSRNVADGNGVYGFFPLATRDGVMSDNEAMDTPQDAAIYVGQSDHVLIKGNRVHDSLLGIEVENSRQCAVIGNDVYRNSVGVFVDVLPFLGTTTQETTLVAFNRVHDNNRPNTADQEDLLAVFPAGIGILLAGADTTAITANSVTDNQFVGIGMISLCLGLQLQGIGCDGLDIEPNPDGNRITQNVVLGNGTVPLASPLDAFRGDLAWDGSGHANCWSANTFATSVPPASDLPTCQ